MSSIFVSEEYKIIFAEQDLSSSTTDSPRVDDDLVGSGEPLTDAQQAALSAEVRVEAADFVGEAGSGMPGYIEEDDDEGAVECISAEVSLGQFEKDATYLASKLKNFFPMEVV